MSNFKTSSTSGMSGGGFTFGTQNPAGSGFAQQPQAATGFGQQPQATSFGQQPQATSFGQQPQATGFGQQPQATGFGQQPQATGFGQLQATGFGQPQATPAATSAPSVGFSFGTLGTTSAPSSAPAISTGSSGFSFGATPTSVAATTVPTMGGFSFGTPTTATSASGGGFALGTGATTTVPGQTTTVPAIGGFGLGTGTTATAAPAPASTSGLSFGVQPIASAGTTAAPITGFSLSGGATVTPASSASTGFTLGGGTAATPAASTGFSLGGGLGGTTAPTSSGFSFGTAQASAAKPAGFGFGMTTTTPQSTVVAVPSVPSTVGLGGTGVGLGGAQPPSANAGANNMGAKSDRKSAKKQQMPQDLFNTIAVFESWRNGENSASEENIRQTVGPFYKVVKKAGHIQQQLAELASEYLQLHASAANLKAEVMKEAEHVEMARRTKETPMALQGENKSPEVYFVNLVRHFEAEMIYCRNKIDEVSMCMQAANNPCETPDDISDVLQREHEALKELASKVYARHSQLVELGQNLGTKTVANDQAFFREHSRTSPEKPISAVVRTAFGGSKSGLQDFQEQQQRAKAVTLGAAPPTMPLAQTSTPSLFGSTTGSSIFSSGSPFGSNSFNLGNTAGNSSFGSKSLFNNSSTGLGSGLGFGMSPTPVQQTASPFSMNSSFTPKPFGS